MKYVDEILRGDIFIYPTDTIYGLGCNALDVEAVGKIRDIKKRDEKKALSVIAPCRDWILENCVVSEELLDRYLPGSYTLILKKKNAGFLNHVSSSKFIGVRISDCEFIREIERVGVPFITTSVNISGEPFARKIEDVSQGILDKVVVVVDAGELTREPSVLIGDGKIIER